MLTYLSGIQKGWRKKLHGINDRIEKLPNENLVYFNHTLRKKLLLTFSDTRSDALNVYDVMYA